MELYLHTFVWCLINLLKQELHVTQVKTYVPVSCGREQLSLSHAQFSCRCLKKMYFYVYERLWFLTMYVSMHISTYDYVCMYICMYVIQLLDCMLCHSHTLMIFTYVHR
jgi:hypothetical protein